MYKSTINLLRALASLKLTLVGIVALLIGVLLSYFDQQKSSMFILPPLVLLAINLLAAIIFNPRIRQNSGLLMFHICLLLLAILTVLSQLSSMKGRVEIVQGAAFDSSNVTVVEQGAWHPYGRLHRVNFVQGDIEVDYVAGLRRGPTRAKLLLNDSDAIVIGDNTAYESNGYRFYTTSNKGFAAIVSWHDTSGGVERGAIHFPSYPLYDWKQHNQWQSPSGQPLEFRLLIDTALDAERAWTLRRASAARIEIVLPDKSVRVLEAGDSLELDNGLLEFEALRMWMGYKIFYDPFLAWFFAAALVGVVGLGWHYYRKLSSPNNARAFAGQMIGRGRAFSASRS